MRDADSARQPGAVLFDIDGTLVDSAHVHINAWLHAVRAVGHPRDAWRIHRGQGMGSSKSLATLLGKSAEQIGPQAKQHHSEHHRRSSGRLRATWCTPPRDGPGWARTRAVFVGDTVWDVQACGKAGVACVGVLSGGISESELTGAGAVAVYEDCRALLRELDASPLAAVWSWPSRQRFHDYGLRTHTRDNNA